MQHRVFKINKQQIKRRNLGGYGMVVTSGGLSLRSLGWKGFNSIIYFGSVGNVWEGFIVHHF